jgi:hypothetical protein
MRRAALFLPTLVTLSAFAVVVCTAACGHTKDSIELRAQSDEVGPQEPPPVASSSSSARAAATTAPPPDPATIGGVADNVPSCPLHCVIATPRHRTLAQDEEDRLRAAFAPTMAGVRQCVYGDHYDGRRIRPPAIIARFSTSGDLLDVGVDGAAWGGSADSCFQSVVRGTSAGPDVRVEGPATVHCAERCEHHPRVGGTRVRKK